MITRDELKVYAKLRAIKNVGHAEIDYFQNIILFIISQSYGRDFIFKGGTALSKCFGLPRFSEDLDFTCKEKPNLKYLEDGLKRFKIEYEIEKEEYANGLKIILRINGPLYIGIKNSLCRIIIDISLREPIILEPEIKSLGRFLEEIPSFDIILMQKKEIFAEKIRAIMTRDKARDIYDLWFLIENKVEFDKKLAENKLRYYNKSWNEKDFDRAVNAKKSIWLSELNPILDVIPEFQKVKKEIIKSIL